MKLHEQILLVADRFGELTNRQRGRVSDMVFRRGGKLQAIADGAELGVRRYERAMGWFSDNWPAGAEWPEGVHRPTCDKQREADE